MNSGVRARPRPKLRDALEPFVQQQTQFAPGEMRTETGVNPAHEGEMPVDLSCWVKRARVYETGGVKVARRIETHEAVALLDLHSMPFEIFRRPTSGAQDRLGAQEFFYSTVGELRIGAQLALDL